MVQSMDACNTGQQINDIHLQIELTALCFEQFGSLNTLLSLLLFSIYTGEKTSYLTK